MSRVFLGNPNQEPKTACEKECIVAKIENATAELKATASDVLELSLGIDDFLLGQHDLTPLSENAEKKAPSGWLESHWEDLANVIGILRSVAEHLRLIRNINK